VSDKRGILTAFGKMRACGGAGISGKMRGKCVGNHVAGMGNMRA